MRHARRWQHKLQDYHPSESLTPYLYPVEHSVVPAPLQHFFLIFQGFFLFLLIASRNQGVSDKLKWQNPIGNLVQKQNTKGLSAFKYVYSLNRKQIPNLRVRQHVKLLTHFPPCILFWDLFSPWTYVWNLFESCAQDLCCKTFSMMCCDR